MPRRYWTSCRDPVSSLLLGGDQRCCHAPSVADVPRRIDDALSPRESSVSRNVSLVPIGDLQSPRLCTASRSAGDDWGSVFEGVPQVMSKAFSRNISTL